MEKNEIVVDEENTSINFKLRTLIAIITILVSGVAGSVASYAKIMGRLDAIEAKQVSEHTIIEAERLRLEDKLNRTIQRVNNNETAVASIQTDITEIKLKVAETSANVSWIVDQMRDDN